MLKIDFLAFYYMETVGVKWPGLKDTNFKLSDTLLDVYISFHVAPSNPAIRLP